MSMLPSYPWLDQSQCFDDAVFDSAWNELIRDLLREMDGALAYSDARLEAHQIKEKFGSLRFYYDLHGVTPAQERAVADALRASCERSKRTCIECSASGHSRNPAGGGGWIIPLCDRHA